MSSTTFLRVTMAAVLASTSLPAFAGQVPQTVDSKTQGSAAATSGVQAKAGSLPAKQKTVGEVDEGSRIFEQNCSRCHNAPEGFSPRISGTVVRHMRVRANLSQHDEQELLRFFNP